METATAIAALGALAQETRLAIFRLLVEHAPDGLPAGAVAQHLDVAPASLSFHFKELARAGLVRARPQGRFVYYAADIATMNRLIGYLTEDCCRAGQACDPDCAPAARQVVPAAMPAAKGRKRA
jgi:ArsR family transcriptional regulator